MPNPPRGVRREPISTSVVEAFDGLHQADIALLNQVNQGQPAAIVAPSNAHHEPQIGLYETVLGFALAKISPASPIYVSLVRGSLGDGGPIFASRCRLHYVFGDDECVRHPNAIRVRKPDTTR